MNLRVYTDNTFMDVEVNDTFKLEDLVQAIDNGSTVMLDMKNGDIFILNTMLVTAFQIFRNTPTIKNS